MQSMTIGGTRFWPTLWNLMLNTPVPLMAHNYIFGFEFRESLKSLYNFNNSLLEKPSIIKKFREEYNEIPFELNSFA